MGPHNIGPRNTLRSTRVGVRGWALALLTVVGLAGIGFGPKTAQAQNCRMHYTEAFQLLSTQSFKGQSPASIKQTVEELFGPRKAVCGENGYQFFLTELEAQAASAFRKKGSEQEEKLAATLEIINHFPLGVRFNGIGDPGTGVTQLRANLTVLSKEVGWNPGIQSVIDALTKLPLPKKLTRPMAKDDDAIPITVPKVPLPAWAIISLYEIRDHAARKETAEITAKTSRILDWVARVAPKADPALLPPGQAGAQPAGQPPVKPVVQPAPPATR